LVEQARPYLFIESKKLIHQILSDEELGEHIGQYADAIVDREKTRVLGSIGGMQKGLNYQMAEMREEANPLTGIMDDDGNISIMGIVKQFVLPRMMSNRQIPQLTSNSRAEAPKAT